MLGKILNFDYERGVGTISGDDGVRYKFVRAEFKGAQTGLRAGMTVDFDRDSEGQVAFEIYPALPSGYSDKNKWIAAVLAFVLGLFGVHKFYLGKTSAGIIMLLCGTIGWLLIIPGLVISLIAFIEFIIYLVKSEQDFHEQYVLGDKAWF